METASSNLARSTFLFVTTSQQLFKNRVQRFGVTSENYDSEAYSGDYEELGQSLEEILNSEREVEELEEDFETVFEYGGLEMVSHLYGLNERERQFDDLFEAYRQFYRFKDFRDGSRRKEKQLNELMEAYREFFGPGSNEQWNEGVELGMDLAPMLAAEDRPLTKEELRNVLEEF